MVAMVQIKRSFVSALAAALTGLLVMQAAEAQTYPTQTIRVIVPFPAGGAVDTFARLISRGVSDSIGHPIVVENRPGAAGNVGAEAVAHAKPDGHTILQTTNGHALNAVINKKLSFDPVKDFVPVTQLTHHPLVLVSGAKQGFKAVKDFIEQAKAKPGRFNYGSTGVGSPLHLAMEMLRRDAGIDLVHVPYRGDAPLRTALIAGEVEVAVLPFATALQHFEDGTLTALAVTTAQRSRVLPDVPTLAESGFPGLEASSWVGWFMPSGTPSDIVERMQKEAAKVLADSEIQARIAKFGAETVASTPAEFGRRFHDDVNSYAKVVKEANIPLLE